MAENLSRSDRLMDELESIADCLHHQHELWHNMSRKIEHIHRMLHDLTEMLTKPEGMTPEDIADVRKRIQAVTKVITPPVE